MNEPLLLARILLTNDDGFDAPGLAVLIEAAKIFAKEVWVLAPEHDQSGTGQSITLHEPLRCRERGEYQWSVAGTPSDCVAIALSHFMADAKPSLILSGINAGANVGDEINLSGTVGAAMTALMLGVPAIALSQAATDRTNVPFATSAAMVPKILSYLLAEGWRKETCLSVNIPELPPEEIKGFSWTRQSQKNIASLNIEKRESPRQSDYFWLTVGRKPPALTPNSEIAALKRGDIAITALTLDRSVDIHKTNVSFSDFELPIADE